MVAKLITTNTAAMPPQRAQPWRRPPTARPNVQQRAEGMINIAIISKKLLTGVGLAYGCAELVLKYPPPSPPRRAIDVCDATGPMGRRCVDAEVTGTRVI